MHKGLLGVAKLGLVAVVLLAFVTLLYSFQPASAGAFSTQINQLSCQDSNNNPCNIVTPESNQYFSFQVTNSNTTANITNVTITLPSGFTFVANSNTSTLGAAALFANVSSNVSWTNATASGLIAPSGAANFTFNASLPNTSGNYTFTITTVDNTSARNSTTVNITIVQPVTAGSLPSTWGDNSSSPPFFWVNISNTTDFFFGNNQLVYMIVNLTSPAKGIGVPGLNVTGNFTPIGGSGVRQSVDLGGGFYRFNVTIDFSAVPGGVTMIGVGIIYITVQNGTGSTVTLPGPSGPPGTSGGGSPVVLVNMSTMPSCPPANHPQAQVPSQMFFNGSLRTVSNCTISTDALCSNTVGAKTDPNNSSRVLLCGPVWGSQTTNFSSVAETGNFSNLQLVLDIPGAGKINFTQGVDFMGQNGAKAGAIMEFAMKNLMSGGKIGINESEWDGGNHSGGFKPSFNGSARLTVYNASGLFGLSRDAAISFGAYSGFDKPSSLSACNATKCQNVVWDGQNITFTVASFSTYVVGGVNYTLIWNNLTARAATVVANQNNTFRINITNLGNGTPTEIYNLTIVGSGNSNVSFSLNDSLFNQSQNGFEIIELNMTNSTAGTYVAFLRAFHFNDTNTQYDINLSSQDDGINFTITVENPTITILNPVNNSNITSTGGIGLNFTNNTQLASCIWTINTSASSGNQTNQTIPNCLNVNILSGNFTAGLNQNITINFNDTFGNGGVGRTLTARVFFSIDNTAPSVTAITSNNANFSGVVRINGSVTDTGGTGVKNVTFVLTNSTGGNVSTANLMTLYQGSSTNGNYSNSTFNTSAFADGNYNVTIIAVDYSGMQGQALINITIDNSAPLVTIVTPTNVTLNASVTINVTVTDSITGINVVRFNLTNNSGLNQVNLTEIPFSGGTNNWNITLVPSQYADGPYVLKIIANNTAGVTNSSVSVAFTIDTVAPGLTSWSYNYIAKNISLTFNDSVNPASIDLPKINITSSDGSEIVQLNMTSSFTPHSQGLTLASTSSPNGTTVQINLQADNYNRIETLLSKQNSGGAGYVQMDIAADAIKGLGGNAIPARTNLNIGTLTNYGVNIALTGSSWNTFNLPRTILENTTLSSSGNYSAINVLSSVEGNYVIIYWNNSGNFSSFKLNSAAGNTFNTFTDQSAAANYWVYMNNSDTLQIQ